MRRRGFVWKMWGVFLDGDMGRDNLVMTMGKVDTISLLCARVFDKNGFRALREKLDSDRL